MNYQVCRSETQLTSIHLRTPWANQQIRWADKHQSIAGEKYRDVRYGCIPLLSVRSLGHSRGACYFFRFSGHRKFLVLSVWLSDGFDSIDLYFYTFGRD